MNTTQLECFMAVAENLNFVRAATELHITQPAVTHQITSLEDELDTKLFIRTTRTVMLTQEGFSFLEDAKNILNLAHGAKARLARRVAREVRYFGIGCHSALELAFMPEVLSMLVKKHPQVHPNLRVISFNSLQNLLADENIDVMMGFKQEDGRKKPGIYQELCKIPISCILSENDPRAGLPSLSVQDLCRGSMVFCDPRKNPIPVARIQSHLIGTLPTENQYFVEDSTCALTLVRAGLGLTLTPNFKHMHFSGLVCLPVTGAELLSYGLYYKSLKNKPILQDFIQEMKEAFRSA